ncbi:MAG: hypothetical protein ABJA71_14735, partial [Ginsengibacter sp.]
NLWFVLAFIFIYWVYYERIMFAEEQFLRKKFGAKYLKWAEQTPAFIPRFKQYKPSPRKFNIRKVLKQEKTGFLLIFLMYFLFDVIGSDIMLSKISMRTDFWFYAMLFAIIAYVTIKLLQTKTTVVN